MTIFALALCVPLLAPRAEPTQTSEPKPLELEATIPLPDVAGRIDHLALDAAREHLFVAALGNDTLELVDLKKAERAKSFAGHAEAQGVVFVAKHDALVVSNGEGQGCDVYDAAKLEIARRVELGPDADNLRYDAARDLVWAAHGEGALSAFEPASGKVVATLKCAGHVESFQLETKSAHVFANVPGARHVAVIDREASKVVATWVIDAAQANFPMALDEERSRLFVGCRVPGRLVVLDTTTGKTVTDVDMSGDVDDLFLDPARKRLYAICGAGYVDVFDVSKPDAPERTTRFTTRAGARTGLFVPERSKLYVAVPKHADLVAEVRVLLVR
jgi:hypothetical protein